MKSKIDHRSPRWFSTGVPVSAMRAVAFSALAARVCLASGFLIACASSRIDEAPRGLGQRRDAQQRAVAGDRQIDVRGLRRRERARSARRSSPRDARSRAFRSGAKCSISAAQLAEQRRRRHQQARRPLTRAAPHQQQRQHLDRLAQSHVVGEAGAEPEAGQQMQPLHAGALIRPQRAAQRRRRDRRRRRRARAAPCSVSRQPRPGGHARPVGDGRIARRRRRPRRRPASASPRRSSGRRAPPVPRPRGTARIARSSRSRSTSTHWPRSSTSDVGAGEQRGDLRLGSAARRPASPPCGNRAARPGRAPTACARRPCRSPAAAAGGWRATSAACARPRRRSPGRARWRASATASRGVQRSGWKISPRRSSAAARRRSRRRAAPAAAATAASRGWPRRHIRAAPGRAARAARAPAPTAASCRSP